MSIIKNIDTQESLNVYSEHIPLLRWLTKNIKSSNEFHTFVNVEHFKYGVLSYESHIIYSIKPLFFNMIKWQIDEDTLK